MNEKFYHLPEEKQLSIINAAYKVFAKSIYKKAPMSEYEDEPEVRRKIQERIRNAKDMVIHRISQKVKADHLRKDVDFESIYREVVYASEGMLIQWYREGNNDVNLFEQEYLRMIGHWEKMYKETETYD